MHQRATAMPQSLMLHKTRHLYQAWASTSARDEVERWCRPRAWYRCQYDRYENSRVIISLSYDRTRLNRQWKLFGLCWKLESNFAEWQNDWSSSSSAAVFRPTRRRRSGLAATTNQTHPSLTHDIWKFQAFGCRNLACQSKLVTASKVARTDIRKKQPWPVYNTIKLV